jgi:hypothetical protein
VSNLFEDWKFWAAVLAGFILGQLNRRWLHWRFPNWKSIHKKFEWNSGEHVYVNDREVFGEEAERVKADLEGAHERMREALARMLNKTKVKADK